MGLYEHCDNFKIKYCDVDFKDELKPSVLLAYLEEVSCSSAEELGFGYSYARSQNCAFIVTSYLCEFDAPIPLGERVQIKTWPTPPAHVILGREYQVFSATGNLLARATSRWCLLDIVNGKILPSKTLPQPKEAEYNPTKQFPDLRWKLPIFSPNDGELKFTITIANSEYDHNMHVNNTRYADYCFNCFSVAELKTRKLKRFAINYVKQCKEGETLRFYLKSNESDGYLAYGFNESDELVVQSLICFEKE